MLKLTYILGLGCYDMGMRAAFDHIFDGVDLPAKINGKLALCVTRIELWPFPHLENEMVSHFVSNDDVIECIIASALIPFALNGRPYVVYRDWICIDGGTTNIAGVRTYTPPSQLDFDKDTTKDDHMHVVPRLRAIMSVFSDLKCRLSEVRNVGYNIHVPRFRASGEHVIQYPMAIEPFGVYGHSKSIISSVVHETYHIISDRLESFPAVVREQAATFLSIVGRNCNTKCENDGCNIGCGSDCFSNQCSDKELPSYKGYREEILSFSSSLLNRMLPMDTIKIALFGENKEDTVISPWWEQNNFQVEQHRAQKLKATTANNDSNEEVKSVKSSFSDFSELENGSSHSAVSPFLHVSSNLKSVNSDSTAATEEANVESADEAKYAAGDLSSCTASVSENSEENYSPYETAKPYSPSMKLSIKKTAKKRNQKRFYWKKKADAVSVTPCGSTQLLITPWMWRKLPLSSYHLTSKGENAQALLELGVIDAAEHHMELLKFFNPDEFLSCAIRHNNKNA